MPIRILDDETDVRVFKHLLNTAPDAVVVVDTEGKVLLVNNQTETMFGYSREELLGQAIEILIPKRFHATHVGHRARFRKVPSLRPMGSGLELLGRRKDGSEFPVEISLSPVETDHGMLASASIRDVTDRKLSEAKEKQLQHYLLSALESIQGAFAIYDAEDKLVICNSSYRVLWSEHIVGEIVGRSWLELLEANLAGGTLAPASGTVKQLRDAYLAYHQDPVGVLDVLTGQGQHLRVLERRTAEGGTVTVLTDTTLDVAREEALKSARSQAEAASAAKSEFLSSMSHELRTPLNAVLGFAQLLQRDRKDPLTGRQKERIEHVLKGGEHLLRLIDEVLDLSRIEAGQVTVSLERVSVADVLLEAKTTLAPMAARMKVQLMVELGSELPDVVADRTRFKQVLMNYGSNAIKYGKQGGTVRFRAEPSGDTVRVCVADDGIGIPENKQHKIFEPFQRAGQETGAIQGTGIGLTITKRLAELMQGHVGFRSSEAQGSEFWIDLPAYTEQSLTLGADTPLLKERASTLVGSQGPRYIVVYIEDNPSNIAFMEDLLSEFERVDLITAPTAEIGLEIVRSELPKAVIMDINLPGMSGIEAARKLREWPETRHIPVVALSASAMLGEAKRIESSGFYRYLTKPLKVDELAQVLEELLVPEVL